MQVRFRRTLAICSGESNGQVSSRDVSCLWAGRFACCILTRRTVTILAEVCNLESEYDASRRRLARKQEIKRHPLGGGDGVLPGHVVLWLVSDDHRPSCLPGEREKCKTAGVLR